MDSNEALKVAARLQQLGIVVRSSELSEHARERQAFIARGGNRAMRRAAKRRRKH